MVRWRPKKDWQAQSRDSQGRAEAPELSYADLAEKLAAIGIKDNDAISQTRSGEEPSRPFFLSSAWKLLAAIPFTLTGVNRSEMHYTLV